MLDLEPFRNPDEVGDLEFRLRSSRYNIIID